MRCPNDATQEDGLCDWCGTRRPEQMRDNPKAMWDADGTYLGLGGRGELHDFPLTQDANGRTPEGKAAACWYPFSGRVVQGQADNPHQSINRWRDGQPWPGGGEPTVTERTDNA